MQTPALAGHEARRWEPKRQRLWLRLFCIPARHACTGRHLLHLASTALALQALDALARLTRPAVVPAPG
jgi:hypothetical protein